MTGFVNEYTKYKKSRGEKCLDRTDILHLMKQEGIIAQRSKSTRIPGVVRRVYMLKPNNISAEFMRIVTENL